MRRALVPVALAALLLTGCLGNPGSQAKPATDPTALQVPTLADSPILDRRALLGEWDAALPITGTFSIRDGSPAAGDYPFEMRIGHDDKWLFAFARVGHVPPNPFNGKMNADGSDKHGFGFDLFLDTTLANELTAPEDWKHFENLREHGSSTYAGYLKDGEWTVRDEGADPENKPWDGDRPTSGSWGRAWYDGSDLLWEIYIPLESPNKNPSGIQLREGDVFRMCLLFDVEGGPSRDARGIFTEPRDTYPGDGYTPDNHYEPATWLRMQLA